MIQPHTILKGESEGEIWNELERNWNDEEGILNDFQIVFEQAGKKIQLNIEIDLGGGFEGGYELTRFSAETQVPHDLHFAIHDKDLLDDLGKFLGMEDKEIGYADFDEKLILKTNDADALKSLFSDESLRTAFLTLENFTLSFMSAEENSNSKSLKLEIEQGITDVISLKEIYHAFYKLLSKLDQERFL